MSEKALSGAVKTAVVAAIVVGAVVFVGVGYLPVYRSTQYIRAAHMAISAGDLNAAHTMLLQASRADAWSDEAASLNGRVCLRLTEQSGGTETKWPELARDGFDAAAARNPADYKHFERLSEAYRAMSLPETAYEMATEAGQRYPGNARVEVSIGRLSEEQGQIDEAITHYRRAVEIEDAFRAEFRLMYPGREVVSRLGEEEYSFAKKRLEELGKQISNSK